MLEEQFFLCNTRENKREEAACPRWPTYYFASSYLPPVSWRAILSQTPCPSTRRWAADPLDGSLCSWTSPLFLPAWKMRDQNRTPPLNILHERSTERTTLRPIYKMMVNLNQADINYTSNKSGRTKSRELALHSVRAQSQMKPLRS